MLSLSKIRLSKFWILAIVLLLASVWLTACGTFDMEVTVYNDDTYSMVAQISFPAEVLQYYGSAEALEAEIQNSITQATEEGVKSSWRKLKTDDPQVLSYEIKLDKASLTEQSDFGWREVKFEGKDAYRIDFTGFDLSGFMGYSITLHAQKILDTNGTKLNASTVQWVNSSVTPYAVVQPKSRFNWIPFIIAAAFLLLFFFIGFITLVTGKLKKWTAAGFSSSKWRMQSIKLNTDQARLQREKDKEIVELGKKAWEARLSHPDYAEPYAHLETMEAQRSANQAQIAGLEGELAQVQQTRASVNGDFTNRITELQNKRKEVSGRLNQFNADKSGVEKRLGKAQKDIEQSQGELVALQNRIENLRASSAPDAAEQVSTLTNAKSALEGAHAQNIADIPGFQAEISRLASEAGLLEGEVKDLDQKIAGLQQEQRDSLSPLDRQIKELQEKVREAAEQNAKLAKEMAPLVEKLGPRVYQAHPDAPALAESYARLSRLDISLGDVIQQNTLLKARLATADPKSVRNFFIFLAVMAVLAVIIIVLLVLSFV